MEKGIQKFVLVLFTAMMAGIVLIVVCCAEGMSFACKRDFSLPQAAMLFIGWGALSALVLLAQRKRKKTLGRGILRDLRVQSALFALCLFTAQCTMCYFSYFMTAWDAGVVFNDAYWKGLYPQVGLNNGYYSWYPNNLGINLLFTAVMRCFSVITHSEPGMERCTFVLIVLQCAINTLTALLTCRMAHKLTQSRAFVGCTAIVYTAFVGFSPWSMIPYTDAMALALPMGQILLDGYAAKSARRSTRCFGYAVMGVAAAVSYRLKPQTVIVTIAIIIIRGAKAISLRQVRFWLVQVICLLLALWLCAVTVFNAVVKWTGYTLDAEREMGLLHYAVMGLNENTNGVYSEDDVSFAMSIESKAERTRAQIGEIKRRITSMGVGGLTEHLQKKLLVNYADGTFAWGIEAGASFYSRAVEDKDDVISPSLKRFFNVRLEGRKPVLETYAQCIWLALLLGAVLIPLAYGAMRAEARDTLCVMMLSVIGLTLFEMIFEARARYLYTYAPVYLLLGLCALWYGVQAAWQRRTGKLKE